MHSSLIHKIISADKLSYDELFSQKGKIYTFLNPVSFLTALDYKGMFGKFDGLFADGSLLVAAITMLYGKVICRKSFDMTSIAPLLFEYAQKHRCSVYFVASRQDQVERAMTIFKEFYPDLIIAGYRNGYFASRSEMDVEAAHIAAINPDFVIAGMGILIQERFLIKLKEAHFKGIAFTCGGFVHQTANNEINYYPEWVNRMNIRFAYRIYKEKHTRRRYLIATFQFPFRFLIERFLGDRYHKRHLKKI